MPDARRHPQGGIEKADSPGLGAVCNRGLKKLKVAPVNYKVAD
jgi:hypothetical protein